MWVNEREVGALDFGHTEITLTSNRQTGENFDILMEIYAGHGPRYAGGGQLYMENRLCQNPDRLKWSSRQPALESGIRKCFN